MVTLSNGHLHPPANGWNDTVFYPIYDDFRDEVDHDCNDEASNDDEYYDEEDYDEDEEYIKDDYTENNGYNGQPQQYDAPEDINEVYSRMMREKHEEELYNEESDYDDWVTYPLPSS